MEGIKTEEEKRLKGRAEKFCEEYIIDYKAERAAVAAGYTPESARNAAWRLLKKDEVRERIRELENIYIEHHSYGSKERIIRETWDTYEKAAAAVPVMAWDYDEHAYKETGEYQFDGKTAAKCLELLMKHHGMLKEKVDASFGTCEGEKLEITVVHEHESTENEHGGAEFEHWAKND